MRQRDRQVADAFEESVADVLSAKTAYAAEREGVPFVVPTVAMRTGDTPGRERQALVRRPPDLLITTPESLYLMLTSEVRSTLVNVETVIIDEIHAMVATKRGAHLALSLERLEAVRRGHRVTWLVSGEMPQLLKFPHLTDPFFIFFLILSGAQAILLNYSIFLCTNTNSPPLGASGLT